MVEKIKLKFPIKEEKQGRIFPQKRLQVKTWLDPKIFEIEWCSLHGTHKSMNLLTPTTSCSKSRDICFLSCLVSKLKVVGDKIRIQIGMS